MKNYTILLICVIFAISTQAQDAKRFIVSTHFGWQGNLSNFRGSIFNTTFDVNGKLSLTPRFAYRLNRTWAIGVSYTYGLDKSNEILSFSPEFPSFPAEIKTRQHTGGMFAQSYIYTSSRLSIFLELEAAKGWVVSRLTNTDNGAFVSFQDDIYSSGLHAGIRYHFYKQLGLEARLNRLASYSYLVRDAEYEERTTDIALFNDLLGNASLGLSFSF